MWGNFFTLFNRIKFKLNAFEPDNTIFNSLKNNVVDAGIAYELALSNSNGKKIFIDSDGANSSLSYFGNNSISRNQNFGFI